MHRGKGASLLWFSPILLTVLIAGEREPARAMQQASTTTAACDMEAVARAKAEFQRLAALHRFDPNAVTMNTLRAASLEYVTQAEACYQELYGPPTDGIDDGGISMSTVSGASEFGLNGRKWGEGSPFISSGPDANGPRIPGGTVTYSFMGDGVDMRGETVNAGPNVAVTSLPTALPCFVDEINSAFAVWSTIANIQFMQVEDNGAPFNAPGAAGDIRIGAHVFDGPSAVLAHGFFPPPNGVSAAGDIHFDVAENWSCSPGAGSIDLGIVAAHEIGHAIGLDHETRFGPTGRVALMNPFYNPSVVSLPLGDDVNGAEGIYGSAVGNSPDVIVDFGEGYGVWIFNYGVGWTQLHEVSPEEIVTGDLDGNGIDDIIVDFGSYYGVWIRMNNDSWFQLHEVSPTHMAVGDLDNNGRDDIVADFEGYGVWRWMNNTTWAQLHTVDSTVFAIGNLDNTAGDDVALTFPGYGVWRWMNNTSWTQVHAFDADQIVVGDLDDMPTTADNADDLAMNIPGVGVVASLNLGAPLTVFSQAASRMATGDLNGDGRDELVVDFGPDTGIWAVDVPTGIVGQIHSVSSRNLIAGDLDGNGRTDLIVDFGEPYGIWILVNSFTWIQLHEVSAEGFAVGDFD